MKQTNYLVHNLYLGLIVLLFFPIQIFSQNWTVVSSYEVPGKASGLAWDGTWLYYGIYGSDGDHMYKVDPSTGVATLLFVSPDVEDAFGLTWDGSYLWTIVQPSSSSQVASATKLSEDGTAIETIALEGHYMSGIAWDDDILWTGEYYPDPSTIYKSTAGGMLLDQFTAPANQPWDICMHDDNLWIVDYNENMIYQVDESGNVLFSTPSESAKPAGVVWDGTYLWYVDGPLGGESTLYKVDLYGTGNPVITLNEDSHDYGTVTIGEASVWELEITNEGTADLEISDVNIGTGVDINVLTSLPLIITEGNTGTLELEYEPTIFTELDEELQIISNDPVTPQVAVNVYGQSVYSGGWISVMDDDYNYGERRSGAWSRWLLEIENHGDSPMFITSIDIDNEFFEVDSWFDFPLEVESLNGVEIGIWFHPEEAINYQAEMLVNTNAGNMSVVNVNLSGEGNDQSWDRGDVLWFSQLPDNYDNSPKSMISSSDITGDGVPEIVVSSEDYYLRCFNGNASVSGDVLWEFEGSSVYNSHGLDLGTDVNEDGYRDIAYGTIGADRRVLMISGLDGTLLWSKETNVYGDGGWVYQVDASMDFTGDGINDVLAAVGNDGEGTGPKRVYCLDGLSGESVWEYAGEGAFFSTTACVDFTGDNVPDAVGGGTGADEASGRVVLIDGSNGSQVESFTTDGSAIWAVLQADDMNNDGIPEIVAGDSYGNFLYVDAANTNVLESGSVGNYSIILDFILTDDINQDGVRDISVASSESRAFVLDGVSGDQLWNTPLADKLWNIALSSDLNGNGVRDIVAGTLFQDNYTYFIDGYDGVILDQVVHNSPVDALISIPDITGDGSMEVLTGGRYGELWCLSGGWETGIAVESNVKRNNMLNLELYPNPTREAFVLSFESDLETLVSIQIVDQNGKEIWTREYYCTAHDQYNHRMYADELNLRSGVYQIIIKSEYETEVQKLIIID
jgi:hypothetical protein